ncbi:MAG: cyanophycinase [Thermoplasmata archaeon]
MPKGPLITVGGKLDMSEDGAILEEFIDIVKRRCASIPTVGILPTASQRAEKTIDRYSDIFDRLGVNTIELNPEDRDEANSEAMIDKAQDADAYFFSGGNQLRITTILGGSELIEEMQRKQKKGSPVGGTSAGAVCMTDLMIAYGESKNALMAGVVELTQGLHFLSETVIDTHFTARGRFPRLVHVVVENPITLGIGLGENTAAIWNFDDDEFRVVGSRNIMVVDGQNIKHTNISEINPDTPLHAEGITVHILSNRCKFDLEEKKPIFPENKK